jgi:AraC-like DNA-binding protein
MDALSHILAGPNARGTFVLRSSLDPPWAMRIEDSAPLTVVTILRGRAYVTPDGRDPVLLRAGDVAVARGTRHYTVGDEVDTEPQVRILPGRQCVTLTGPPMSDVGVRTWGNADDGATLMLNGTYESQSTVGSRLLANLPELIVAPREHVPTALVDYLAEQVSSDEPGQDALLDRMLDLILIAVLRWWFASRQQGAGWYRAYADPVVGRALRLMQEDPAQGWTVARLATATGLSRAAFARRFTDLVGEPPMTFLTTWRLSLAADLLAEPGTTVAAVARRVGYATPFAFSTAFKRFHEVSPRQHRRHLQDA